MFKNRFVVIASTLLIALFSITTLAAYSDTGFTARMNSVTEFLGLTPSIQQSATTTPPTGTPPKHLANLNESMFTQPMQPMFFFGTAVSYTGMGAVTCPANPTATISPSVTGLTFSQLTRGAGVTCSSLTTGISGTGFNDTLANNITNSKWYTFSITSDSTVSFTVDSLSILSQVSNATGSPSESVQYSIGAGAKTAIGSFTPTASGATYTVTPGTSISVGASQTINIFIIPNTLTASGTTCRITNATSVTVTTAAAGITAPVVTSSAATSITTTAGTLNGNVTSDGGDAVTDRGFVYKTSAGATIGDNKTTVAGTTGAFTLTPTLAVNTQYFFKAYGINGHGTTLSSPELSFYTLANAPSAPTVANPTQTSLDVTIGSGDGNPAATTYAIQETTSGNYV